MKNYKTVSASGEAEFIERKSRFIGSVSPVSTQEEALAFIEEKKTLHWQATHNCYAYTLLENGTQRYSDDGEPQGTAGIPILEILRKEEIFNAVIVVTRYYGGIHLGAGGLIRAYSQGAKIALDAGGRITMAPCTLLNLTLPYPLYDRFLAAIQEYPLAILDSQFTSEVAVSIQLQSSHLAEFTALVTDLSAGEVAPIITGDTFAPL